jgi:hypothetical protein
MAIGAATLFGASAIHFGLFGPIDSFAAAALPEAIIGGVLALGLIAKIVWWPGSWPVALAATLFAVAGTLFGLSVTIPRGEIGDIAYHLALFAILLAATAMLVRARPRARSAA